MVSAQRGKGRVEDLTETQEQPQPVRRVLFVCGGNTCRSPMAAALAAHDFPADQYTSAGLDAGSAIAVHAVTAIDDLVHVDISGHVPMDMDDVEVASFDAVVVLDQYVGEVLERRHPGVDIVVAHIDDPYGGSIDDYKNCARDLRAAVAWVLAS